MKVIFNRPVKYKRITRLPNVAFEIDDKDANEVLSKGGHQIIEATADNPAKPVLGSVNANKSEKSDPEITKENPYKGFKKEDLISELEARGINDASLINNEKRLARLLQDDVDSVSPDNNLPPDLFETSLTLLSKDELIAMGNKLTTDFENSEKTEEDSKEFEFKIGRVELALAEINKVI